MNQSVQRRRPGAKLLALIASLTMMLTGLVGVVLAPAASAHHPAVSGVPVCLTDGPNAGKWEITWTVSNGDEYWNSDKPMQIIASSNESVIPLYPTTPEIAPNGSTTGKQIVSSTGTYSLTIDARWPNGTEWKWVDGKLIQVPKYVNSDPKTGYVKIEGTCGTAALDVSGEAQCVPAEGKWTVTWTVTNKSTGPAKLKRVTTSNGMTPSEYTNVPVNDSRTFTQTGVGTLPTSATFKAEFGDKSATKEGTATSTSGCEQIKPAIEVSVSTLCVNDEKKWTITWTVKNTSSTNNSVTVTPPAGLDPAGPQVLAQGESVKFTKKVNSTGDYPATFNATWAVNDQTAQGSATAEVSGECTTYTYTGEGYAQETICYNGNTIVVKAEATVTKGPRNTPFSPADKEAIDDEADAKAELKLAEILTSQYEGFKKGVCEPEAGGRLSCEAGLTFLLVDFPAEAPVKITGLPQDPIFTEIGPDGSLDYTYPGPLPDGTYTVNVYVAGTLIQEGFNEKLRIDGEDSDAVVDGPPTLTLGPITCSPDTFSAAASNGASADICTADGKPGFVSVVGTGSATSTESQAAAQAAADGAAQTDADNKLAAAIAAQGKAGQCTPTEEEQPAAVVAPAAATVAAPAPATVSVPAAATVPAAVPAGDGSQSPSIPLWALAMIVLGALGMATAGLKMAKDSK